jgi:ubiquinone/menaquinone biosynthesis C-methylase UbiE
MNMKMDFHAEKNKTSYTGRGASDEWRECISGLVDIRNKAAADIGCGGGIYSRALVELGAAHVSGVDFSAAMLDGARDYCAGIGSISFQQGTVMATGLEDAGYDVVLERAVIHHFDDYEQNFTELFRILKPGGQLIIQDRTIADVKQPPSVEHIRGYFFQVFPKLLETEAARRPDDETVRQALTSSGFARVKSLTLWETRKIHPNMDVLGDDIVKRTGRSLLHALADDELQQLVDYLQDQLPNGKLVEKDRWTLWTAERPSD